MIKCPNSECGYENVDGTQFCEMCGEELTPDATSGTAPAAAAPSTSTDTIKCPACENLNSADNVVCEVCGTELRPHDDAAAVSAGTSSSPATPSVTPFDAAIQPDEPKAPDTPADSSFSFAGDAVDNSPSAAPDVSADAAAPDIVTATSTDATPAVVDTSPIASNDATPVPAIAPDVASAAPTSADSDGELQPGKVKLTVEQGMAVGKEFVLGDAEIQVGREDEEEGIYPDIDLSDQDEGYVHRRHATLKFENGALTVTHLGGANKTRLNNRPLPDNEAQPVKIGDKIAFGKVVTRVQPHA